MRAAAQGSFGPDCTREPRWRVLLCLLAAIAVHLGVVPPLTWWLLGRQLGGGVLMKPAAPTVPPAEVPPAEPVKPEVRPGDAEAPDRLTVAWISHDDFQEMLAPKSQTEQPAVQQQADPAPQAPMVVDATDPAPVTDPTPPAPPPTEAAPAEAPPAETPPAEPVVAVAALPEPVEAPEPPETPQTETTQAVELPKPVPPTPPAPPTPPSPPQTAVTPTPPTPPAPPTPPTPPQPEQEARPTTAARADKESTPTTLTERDLQRRPGRVLVGRGIEIKTVAPRLSLVAQLSSLPRNPLVLIRFDRDGAVIEARVIESSGYANTDAPVLASLYRWRATGPMLKELEDPLELRIRITFSND